MDVSKWFRPAVYIGVLINILGMALPFVFAPQWYLDLLGLPGGGASTLWMRQAGILLFYVSLLYLPGANDPFRHPLSASFAVVTRMSMGLYWLWLVFVEGRARTFLVFAALDCLYAAFLWFLLWRVWRRCSDGIPPS